MNEVVNVSIAGISFILETEAYRKLKSYLDKLVEVYSKETEGPEIVSDIEARIAEIILSDQQASVPVTGAFMKTIIEQLGEPDQIGETTPQAKEKNREEPAEVFPKRLYRDREYRKLGGVFSGMGRFLNVDPVWLRIGLFLPLILLIILATLPLPFKGNILSFLGTLFGAFFLLYFLLWIAIPSARTPRQQLEMKGRKVTAANISQTAKQSSGRVNTETVLSQLVGLLGRILIFVIKFFFLVAGIALGLAAIGVLVALVAMLTGNIDSGIWMRGNLVDVDIFSSTGFVALVLFAVLLPLVMLVYQILRMVFNFRNNPTAMWIMGGAWLISLIWTGVLVGKHIPEIRSSEPAHRNYYFESYEDYARYRLGEQEETGTNPEEGTEKIIIEEDGNNQ